MTATAPALPPGTTRIALSPALVLEWKSPALTLGAGGIVIAWNGEIQDIRLPEAEGWIRLVMSLPPSAQPRLAGMELALRLSECAGATSPRLYFGEINPHSHAIRSLASCPHQPVTRGAGWHHLQAQYLVAADEPGMGGAFVLDLPHPARIELGSVSLGETDLLPDPAAAAALIAGRARPHGPVRTQAIAAGEPAPSLFAQFEIDDNGVVSGHVLAPADIRLELRAGPVCRAMTAGGITARQIGPGIQITQGFRIDVAAEPALRNADRLEILALQDTRQWPLAQVHLPHDPRRMRLEVTQCDGGYLEGFVAQPSLAAPIRVQLLDENDRMLLEGHATDEAHHVRLELPSGLQGDDDRHLTLSLVDDPVVRSLVLIPGRKAVQGEIETLSSHAASGWARLRQAPDMPVTVLAELDGRILGKTRAEVFRADLAARLGDAGFHGFQLRLDRAVPAERMDDLVLRVAESGTALPRGPGMAPEASPPATGTLGRIDRIDTNGVSGWAMAPGEGSCLIGLEVNGLLIASVLADAPRQDVARSLASHGRHGFHIGFPEGLHLPAESRIRALILPDGTALPGGPELWSPKLPGVPHPAPPELASARRERHLRPLPGPPPDRSVAVIVLNRDGAAHLEALFASFAQHETWQHYRIILVDHGSQDDSRAVCARWQERLSIQPIWRGENHGFSASNNLAASLAHEDVLLFLNNDIILREPILGRLIGHLEDPRLGAVGMRLISPEAPGEGGEGFVQHLGIKFGARPDRPAIGAHELPQTPFNTDVSGVPWVVPAVTAAAMAMRCADFQRLGGFDERYFYGYEDVDLCLGLRHQLGLEVLAANDITAIHARGATRSREAYATRRRHARNAELLDARFGSRVRRDLREDIAEARHFWRDGGLRLAFAVSRADLGAPEADILTAWELGEHLVRDHGWQVSYLEPDQWYELDQFEVVVAMRPDFDPRRITRCGRDLLRIAWARNWIDRWLDAPWLDAWDLIWPASERAAEAFRARTCVPVELMRLASNPERFHPETAARAELASDLCFTGSFFRAPREIITALMPDGLGHDLAIFGHGWDQIAWLKPWWRGPLPYHDIPAAYASTRLVIDDATASVKSWGSVNCRVYDALAAGRLVLSNGAVGADEVFGGRLPIWRDGADLRAQVDYWLEHPEEMAERVAELRAIVLAQHSYGARAQAAKTSIATLMRAGRIVLHHHDQGAQRAGSATIGTMITGGLRARGCRVRLTRPDDASRAAERLGDDVVLHLSSGPLPPPQDLRADQLHLRWHLGPLADLSLSECRAHDALILCEAEGHDIHAQTGRPVLTLFDSPSQQDACLRRNAEGALQILDARALQRAMDALLDQLAAWLKGQMDAPPPRPWRAETALADACHLSQAEPVRLVFWPDYRATNPYQSLVLAEPPELLHPEPGSIDHALALQLDGQGPVVFHLHWLTPIIGDETTQALAELRVEAFLAQLRAFRAAGGRVIWTLHNLIAHEAPFPKLERALAAEVVALADLVHLHGARTVALAKGQIPLQGAPLRVAQHGSYLGVYPDEITEEAARARLGLPQGARVLLHLGQLRGYKGLDALISSFAGLDEADLHLVIAGRPVHLEIETLQRAADACPRVRLIAREIADDEIQLLMRAADLVVLPYAQVLTSGGACLALSFGRPVIAPRLGLLPDLLRDGIEGLLYAPDTPGALATALLRAAHLSPEALAGMQAHALARAEASDWRALRALIGRDALALSHGEMIEIQTGTARHLCQIRRAPLEDPPRVVAIILHYHELADTTRAIRALLAQDCGGLHVVVVSNDETGHAFVQLARAFPLCTLIQAPENLGYAGGNNLGLAHGRSLGAEYLWVLNPDIEAPPDHLRRAIETAELAPDVAVCGALITRGDAPDRVWFGGGRIGWDNGLVCEHLHSGARVDDVPQRPIPSDYITGASLFFRSRLIDDMGWLPEDHFLYFEESDWCLRLREAGLQLVTYPWLRLAHHKRSEEDGAPKPHVFYYYCRNAMRLTLRHRPDELDATEARLRALSAVWLGRLADVAPEQIAQCRALIERALDDGRQDISGRAEL